MLSDSTLDTTKFTSVYLPFIEDFPGDYKSICNKMSHELFGIKEIHLLRVMLMKCVEQEKHAQILNELNSKLAASQGNLAKG